MQVQSGRRPETSAAQRSGLAGMVLALGGLAGAFGAAACCALPVALAWMGLGSVSLLGIAGLVGPFQPIVLGAALLCAAGAGVALWRASRARACRPCGRADLRAADVVAGAAFVLATGLILLTLVIEPPL